MEIILNYMQQGLQASRDHQVIIEKKITSNNNVQITK